MPFTYVVHVRTFLLIYLLGLPFILVSDLDWVMLVAVVFVGYLMFGLENTAVQLENPFGTDCNHHPLDPKSSTSIMPSSNSRAAASSFTPGGE